MNLFGTIGHGGAGLKSVLKATVQSFDGIVRLRMVGGGLAMRNIEHLA
jgi:hypothetical protein